MDDAQTSLAMLLILCLDNSSDMIHVPLKEFPLVQSAVEHDGNFLIARIQLVSRRSASLAEALQ